MSTESNRADKLPDEILDAHKSRGDYLKWKLILIAGLGAASLGSSKFLPGGQPQLIALIPWVCMYVDLLCDTLMIRVIVIGSYYADSRRDAYEKYAQLNRQAFLPEKWAQFHSTLICCIVVIVAGLFLKELENYWLIVGSGTIGAGLSYLLHRQAQTRLRSLIPAQGSLATEDLALRDLIHPSYSKNDLERLGRFLKQKGVFIFPSLPNGLFSAAGSAGINSLSGYQYCWVRDNVHVAHAHLAGGDPTSASRTAISLMNFFHTQRERFVRVINAGSSDNAKKIAADPMNRPHVRFDGRHLGEITQIWAHAQNDAIGYFLWLYCTLAKGKLIKPDEEALRTLSLFAPYLEAIEYWRDHDSGHWEEARKVSASSIGTVVAGLRELELYASLAPSFEKMLCDKFHPNAKRSLCLLRKKGEQALGEILPCESIEPEACYRRYDAALLFLIYPLEAVNDDMAGRILDDVTTHLQGDHGIRRYLGDSYWFPDYKKIPEERRTADFSMNMQERDACVESGREAQWCIFDPIISVIYGRWSLRCQESGDRFGAARYAQLQTTYFNRAIRQLKQVPGTGSYEAAEAYYIENGSYTPNDHTPLLWTQANLWMAVTQMERVTAAANNPSDATTWTTRLVTKLTTMDRNTEASRIV